MPSIISTIRISARGRRCLRVSNLPAHRPLYSRPPL
jgi:hypothetical protein